MAYRFKTRSTTPGASALKQAAITLVAGYPAVGDVSDGVFFGTSGTEFEGELSTEGISVGDIVSADYVLTGHDNYVGGDAGNLTLPDAGDVSDEATFGTNGGTSGTLDLGLYRLITPTTGDMAGYEKKTERRAARQKAHTLHTRVYEVPFGSTPALPLEGAYFPGETSGPRVMAGGVSTSPIPNRSGEPTNIRVTIVAASPLYVALEGDSFTYGL